MFFKNKGTYGTQITSWSGGTDQGYFIASLGFTYTYCGTAYTQVTVNTNGYVCLGSNTLCAADTRPTVHNILVGLNKDLNTASGSGQVYYQSISSGTYFTTATTYTNTLYPSFVPTNGFMITYDGVYPYSFVSAAIVVSFQIFILTDGSTSYVVFSYTNCATGASQAANSGLSINNGGSLVEKVISNECTSSNVGVTGVWVNRVDTYASGN